MASGSPGFRLLLITDGRQDGQDDGERLVRRVEAALAALPDGVAALQLREKGLTTRALVAVCRRLLPVCRAHRTPLLVNDRCDVALALGLDGVHLAQSSVCAADARTLLGPAALVGVSCHDQDQLERATGADYATWGPIFAPRSKPSQQPPIGLASFRVATSRGLPLYALGGIAPENARAVRASGAHGLAVIGSGLGADDPAAAVAALWRAWE